MRDAFSLVLFLVASVASFRLNAKWVVPVVVLGCGAAGVAVAML